MKSKRGIYYDIEESDYCCQYYGMTFYFSSDKYRMKFEKRVDNFINEETIKLEIITRCNLVIPECILLKLYYLIETRGFRVYYRNKRITPNTYFTLNVEV